MTKSSALPDKALIIGESLVDLIKREGDPGEPVGHPGGSPLNVALTLGRLGQNAELVTALADDDHGRQVTKHLHRSNVRLGAGTFLQDRTSTALALIGETGAATYVFDFEWDLPGGVPLTPNTAFVHTGSISSTEQPGATAVLEAMLLAGATSFISYDPNIRPTIMPPQKETLPIVENLVRASDLVKVSDEDLEWLYPGTPLEDVVNRWFEISDVALVVVTAGKAGPGIWSRAGHHFWRKPADVKVVDTVGAGDSFMGGLLDALWRRGLTYREGAEQLAQLSQAELEAIVDEANAVANITVSRAGANPPWLEELDR